MRVVLVRDKLCGYRGVAAARDGEIVGAGFLPEGNNAGSPIKIPVTLLLWILNSSTQVFPVDKAEYPCNHLVSKEHCVNINLLSSSDIFMLPISADRNSTGCTSLKRHSSLYVILFHPHLLSIANA
jgi:hypothetical protein